MGDHISIGHNPIISDHPIIARAEISEAYRSGMRQLRPMTIGAKLKQARKERGLTQLELAQKLGVAQSVISNLETGELRSWATHADALSKALGKERSFFGSEPDLPPTLDASRDLPSHVEVPEYDVRLSAGPGFYVDQETTRRTWTLPRFLVVDQLGLVPNRATVQEVVGDSMEPTLSSGDVVLLDLTDQRIGLPGVFAVWDGDALVCKRIERIPGSEPAEVRLKSDNPLDGEYRVREEAVNVVGRVRWVMRRM